MQKKRDIVKNCINNYNSHIIGIAETWLHKKTKLDLINIENYTLIRNDRNLIVNGKQKFMQGGGVACYMHKSLKPKEISKSENTDIKQTEYLAIEASSISSNGTTRLLVVIVYRTPGGDPLDKFFEKLDTFIHSYKNIMILGDFNVNILPNSQNSDQLVPFIDERALSFIKFGATNFTATSETAIDSCIVDSAEKVLSYSKTDVPIAAGHRGLNFAYKIYIDKQKPKEIKFRDFKKCNITHLKNNIVNSLAKHHDFDQNLNSKIVDPSASVEALNKIIIENLDVSAPFTVKTQSKPCAPWITQELKQACKDRDALYKKAQKEKSQVSKQLLLNKYKTTRRNLKRELLRARQEYFKNQIAAASDTVGIWKLLDKEGLTKQKPSLATDFFTPQQLNVHFAAMAQAQPSCSIDELNEIISDIDPNDKSLFSFKHITPLEIYNTAKSLLKKSRGRSPDGIPLKYIESFIDDLLPFLAKIFNSSIDSNLYPEPWKRAYIIPLNKTATPKSISETRPIANLCHLAKIFDKCIATQILTHLESTNQIIPYQYGFRSDYNTQLALLRLTDIIREGIENDLVTLCVLFDFKKAFDSLKHLKLLLALKRLKFSSNAIKWLHSYITGRLQTVLDKDNENTLSDYLKTTSGVPQGSSPGPVLFLALINSLPSVLKFCKLSYILFADDLELIIQCPTCMLPFAIAHLNEDIQHLEQEANSIGMYFHPAKIRALLFGSSENRKACASMNLPPIIVSGETIPLVNQAKSLGITLSVDLSWDAHLSSLSSRVHYVLHKLRFRGWLLSTDVKKMLAQALVLPIIDYACLVYNDLNGDQNLKVQRLVNASIRFIYNLKRDESITPYRIKLDWLKVENRRLYLLGRQVLAILHSQRPPYLYNALMDTFQNVRRSQRLQTTNIVIPICSTTSLKDSFFIKACELLSDLRYDPITTTPNMFLANLDNFIKEKENQ